MEMSRLPVPIVTLVTGEGGSGGALALAVGDRVLMMENSYYSVISPEGCSTILFKDAAQAPRAAEALRLTAADLLRLGIMDAVVPEPEGGAHTDARGCRGERQGGDRLRACASCVGTPAEQLLENRYERFRKFGAPGPAHPSADRGERMTESTANMDLIRSRLGGGARPRQAARGLDRAALLGAGGRDEDRDRADGLPVSPWLLRALAAAAAAAPAAAGEPELDGAASDRRAARRDVLPVLGARRQAVRRGGGRGRRGADGRDRRGDEADEPGQGRPGRQGGRDPVLATATGSSSSSRCPHGPSRGRALPSRGSVRDLFRHALGTRRSCSKRS